MSFMDAISSTEGTAQKPATTVAPTPVKAISQFSDSEMEKWILSVDNFEDRMCCLIYGADGTGKTGIALDYLTDEDVANGRKAVIIDLDGGNMPLLNRYHANKKQNIIIKNPLTEGYNEDDVFIDYEKTFAKMRGIVKWVRNNYEKQKIKFIVLDGLSTALKHAEYQMRLEKNIDADGGVQTRYWLVRNKLFLELLEQIKSLPISKFYIAHEDFILKIGEENSSVKEKTNAMAHQKIRCERKVIGDEVKFKAIIDKSKYNVRCEGKEIIFCTNNKTTGECKWDVKKVFEGLI